MHIGDVKQRGRDAVLAAAADEIADDVVSLNPIAALNIPQHRRGDARLTIG